MKFNGNWTPLETYNITTLKKGEIMKLTTAGTLVLGLGILAGTPQVVTADSTNERRTDADRLLRDAVVRLQYARYDLGMADRKFGGERAAALQQTQFAMEQLFAAVDDKKWQGEDRDLWEKQRRETEQAVEKRERDDKDHNFGDQPYVRAESALKNLREARRLVDKVEGAGFSGHKSKALVHIDEAIKSMNRGIEKAKEGKD